MAALPRPRSRPRCRTPAVAGMWQRLAPLVILVAVLLVLAGAAELAPTVVQRRMTQGLINLVAVVGLYVFVGNSGVLSFGNVAFMAIGAYVSALLTMPAAAKGVFLPDLPAFLAQAEWPVIAGALAGGAVAALVAAVAGFPLMRLSGISASIATFAILVVAYVVLGNWTSVTGGQNSLMGLPIYVGLWTAAAWAIVAVIIAFVHQEIALRPAAAGPRARTRWRPRPAACTSSRTGCSPSWSAPSSPASPACCSAISSARCGSRRSISTSPS